MQPIQIFAGNFGSGKTELAVETALRLAPEHKTALVDFDIINPYFRSSNQRAVLEKAGVRVIAPPVAGTNAGLYTPGAEVQAIFADADLFSVLDVGGDPIGAVALGQLSARAKKAGYAMHFVINARRPLTGHADAVIGLMQEIEQASRLQVTDLINNTNLAAESSAEDVLFGQEVCQAVSEKTGLAVAQIALKPDVYESLPGAFKKAQEGRFFIFIPRMRQAWFDDAPARGPRLFE
jgi:hypothetical protein